MARLDRAAILAAEDLPTITVDVPEWNTKIDLATVTAADFARWQEKYADTETGPDSIKSMAALIVLTARDEQGEALFNNNDRDALTRKNARALVRLFRAALDINAVTDEANEEIEKN